MAGAREALQHMTEPIPGDEVGISFEYDWREIRSPSIAVVEAMSVVLDRDPTEMEPISRRIDVDAVDSLLTTGGPGVRISFVHQGCRVDVTGDGKVEIHS